MTSRKSSTKGLKTRKVPSPALNEAKARILIVTSQVTPPKRYSRFLAMKLGYTYDYVNKQVQELEFLGFVTKERHGQKFFIVIKDASSVEEAKRYLHEHRAKQTRIADHGKGKG